MIACARYRIDDERVKASYKRGKQKKTHVIFLIHVPRYGGAGTDGVSTFVGFQGGAWISAHIDDIRAPGEGALTLNDALSAPISELFYNMLFSDDEVMEIEESSFSDINTQNMDHITQQNMDFVSPNEGMSYVSDAQGDSSDIDNEKMGFDSISEELPPVPDIEMESFDDQVSSIMHG